MQQNEAVIAGNLAADCKVIKEASPGRDMLVFSVYTDRSTQDGQGNYLNDVQNIVSFGKAGIFDKFSEKLVKGKCVHVTGSSETRLSEKDGVKYYNHQINASYPDGKIDIMMTKSVNKNRLEIMGFLAQDAEIRPTKNGEVLNMVVITSKRNPNDESNPYTARHSVVKFAKKGELSNMVKLLKKGAGVTTYGSIEHNKSEKDGKTYYNTSLNATFSRIQITKYVTEKEQQNAPQQQGGYEQQQHAQQHQGGYEQQQHAQQHQGGYEQQQQQHAQQHQGGYDQGGYQPQQRAAAPQQRAAAPQQTPNFDDFDDDIPF